MESVCCFLWPSKLGCCSLCVVRATTLLVEQSQYSNVSDCLQHFCCGVVLMVDKAKLRLKRGRLLQGFL